MIDAHAHPQLHQKENMESHRLIFACSTCPEDWETLEELKSKNQNLRIGYGLHPWKVRAKTDHDFASKLKDKLSASTDSFMGEIGLDRSKKWRDTYKIQLEAFEKQLEIACELKKPVVLHVVRAHDDVLKQLKARAGQIKVYLHGFQGNPQTAAAYKDCWIGFNLKSLRSHKVRETLKSLPPEKLLVESDGAPNLECLEETMKILARLRKWSLKEAIQTTTENALEWLENHRIKTDQFGVLNYRKQDSL